MNKENTRKLFKRYPGLYRGVHLPLTENLMRFGFECGDGWFQLIDELSAKITRIAGDPVLGDDYPMALQVKEKFGGLRFYISGGSKEVFDAIEEAENKSMKVCESCGQPGDQGTGGGWVVTLCHGCRETRALRREKE